MSRPTSMCEERVSYAKATYCIGVLPSCPISCPRENTVPATVVDPPLITSHFTRASSTPPPTMSASTAGHSTFLASKWYRSIPCDNYFTDFSEFQPIRLDTSLQRREPRNIFHSRLLPESSANTISAKSLILRLRS